MRCQSMRSVFRGLLVAGLVATSQNALIHASWKDRAPPFGGTCFVHDLDWDRSYSLAARSNFARSNVDADVEAAAADENELCLAAAEKFELQVQVEAVLATLKSVPNPFSNLRARIFLIGSKAGTHLISAIDHSALKIVQWLDCLDVPPETEVESDEHCEFASDWNCGDWANHASTEATPRMPARIGGNVFVYAIDAEPESTQPDPQSDLLCNPNATAVEPYSWQVGVDPVCPELQDRNATITWQDSVMLHSVCCPISTDDEAICAVANPINVLVENRPPVLEAECESPQTTQTQEWTQSESDVSRPAEEPTSSEPEGFSIDENLDSSPYGVEEKYERTTRLAPDNSTRLIDSLGVTEWAGNIGRRFNLSNFDPRVPAARSPFGSFSLEDLVAPPKSRSLIFDTLQSTFSPARGDATPLPQSHSVADSQPVNPVSKYLANRIRTVGLILIDFASQLDSHQGQVEIAGGTSQPVR